jgi:hypothetical protein
MKEYEDVPQYYFLMLENSEFSAFCEGEDFEFFEFVNLCFTTLAK